MKTPRAVLIAAVIMFVAAMAVLLVGCAGGLNAARQTVANAAEVQAKGFKVLVEYDEQYQKQIVDAAVSKGDLESGKKALADYRAKRKKAVDALQYAAATTLMAEALIPLVERGVQKQTELDGWIAELLKAGIKVYAAFKELGLDRLALGFQGGGK